MELSEVRYAMENCELFKGLDKKSIDKLIEISKVENYQAGEYIFQQGDFGERIYIIAEGHIYLERSTNMGSRKGNAVIGMLGRGRAFGCWSTLLGESHNLMSSAICRKPTIILGVSGPELREIMIDNTELGFNVMEKLCFLLRDRIEGAYGAMEKI